MIGKLGSTNIALRYLLLKATNKKIGERKAQFDCIDKSYI